MTTPETEPEKTDPSASSLVDSVKLPVVRASKIVNEIADQAPLYGLSGAILAVGLVTGRRALARTGARMLTSQVIAALARAASERLLPTDSGAEKAAEEKPASAPPAVTEEPPTRAKPANAARIATGALAGATALAAGGWLLSRLLKSKSADKDEAKD